MRTRKRRSSRRRTRRSYKLFSNPRRRRTRRRRSYRARVAAPPPVRRRSRRSRPRRNIRRRYRTSIGGGALNLRSLLSRENLLLAGGAVASGVITNFVISTVSKTIKLPGINTVPGAIAYNLLIPVGAAYFLRRVQPTLAKGVVLGGVIAALNAGLKATGIPQRLQPTSEYLDATGTWGIGPYAEDSQIGWNPDTNGMGMLPPQASATEQFSGLFDSESAFSDNAWQ